MTMKQLNAIFDQLEREAMDNEREELRTRLRNEMGGNLVSRW